MIPNDQQIQRAIAEAPDYVRDFLLSPELADIFESIREEHKLHLDDAERLSRVITGAVLDIIPFEQVASSIELGLEKVSPEVKQTITRTVNEKVFEELRVWALADKEVEKEIAEKGAAPTETAPVKQGAVNKLEHSIRETPAEVTVSLPKTDAPVPPPTQQYRGSDPYREPIA